MAPSVQQKVDCHLKVVEDVCKPPSVTRIIAEVASFDIQKIKDPKIHGTDYQQGDQLGFWNVRESMFFFGMVIPVNAVKESLKIRY